MVVAGVPSAGRHAKHILGRRVELAAAPTVPPAAEIRHQLRLRRNFAPEFALVIIILASLAGQ
jgi:hypothetical protein